MLENSFDLILGEYRSSTKIIVQGDYNVKIGQLNQITEKVLNTSFVRGEIGSKDDGSDRKGRKLRELMVEYGLMY